MQNNNANMKRLSDLELEINNIKDIDSFSNWLELAVSLTSDLFGDVSISAQEARNIKRHFIYSPVFSFDLNYAINEALKLIEISYQELEKM